MDGWMDCSKRRCWMNDAGSAERNTGSVTQTQSHSRTPNERTPKEGKNLKTRREMRMKNRVSKTKTENWKLQKAKGKGNCKRPIGELVGEWLSVGYFVPKWETKSSCWSGMTTTTHSSVCCRICAPRTRSQTSPSLAEESYLKVRSLKMGKLMPGIKIG